MHVWKAVFRILRFHRNLCKMYKVLILTSFLRNKQLISSISKIATKFNCKFYDKYTRLLNIWQIVSEAFFFLIGSIKAWSRQLTMTKSSSSQKRITFIGSSTLSQPIASLTAWTRYLLHAPPWFSCAGQLASTVLGGYLLLLLLTGSPSSWREVTDLLSYCYHSPWSFQSLYYSWFGVRLLAKLFREVFAIICATWVILFAGFATVCMEMKAYFPKKRLEI